MKGKLEILKMTGGGFDLLGDPIPVSEIWSNPIPCLIVQNSYGFLKMYEGGTFVPSSYRVLIGNIKHATFVIDGEDTVEEIDLKVFKLYDSRAVSLGEKTVLPENIKYLDAVQRIQILI